MINQHNLQPCPKCKSKPAVNRGPYYFMAICPHAARVAPSMRHLESTWQREVIDAKPESVR